MNRSAAPSELPRSLGLLDALAIVIGIVIGGGIFIVPNLLARELRSPPLILAVWVLAGILSFLAHWRAQNSEQCYRPLVVNTFSCARLGDR